jgi:hypothetical protein
VYASFAVSRVYRLRIIGSSRSGNPASKLIKTNRGRWPRM